jgi:hypothetical protein
MAYVEYEYAKYWQKQIPIESSHNMFLSNSLHYANRFYRFSGAIVPRDCYQQSLRTQGKTLNIFHASLDVEPNISQCHKFLWSARHGSARALPTHPDSLEVFAVLTFIGKETETAEIKVCDILFPGVWALQMWKKYLCLWYHQKPILKNNPKFPEGLLYADHIHLQSVLGDFSGEN